MMQKITKVSNGLILLLLITLVSATAVPLVPAITSSYARQNGWLSLLIPATMYGLAVVWVTVTLALRFPGEEFGQYVKKIVGRPLGVLIGFLYLFFLLHLTGIIIVEFGQFLNTAFMPETPLQIFNLTLIILAAYAVYHGLEVIVRINQWVFPMLLASFLLIIVLLLPEAKLERVLPVMADGVYPVLRASFSPAAFRGEVFLLLFLVPHVDKPQTIKAYGAAAVILLGLLLALDDLVHSVILGSELSATLTFPTFVLARYVQIGEFFTRIEALDMVLWVGGVVIKVSIIFWAAANCVQNLFRINHRWAIIPLSLILFFTTPRLFKNVPELTRFLDIYLPPYALVFEFIIPSLLLLTAWLRKIGGKSSG